MCICRLTTWNARTGNNFIQIKKMLIYAIQNKCSKCILLPNIILSKTEYNIENGCKCAREYANKFWKDVQLQDCSMTIVRQWIQKYIVPLLSFELPMQCEQNVLHIHIRAGDIFTPHRHNKYVQPPLSYYTNIITNGQFNKVVIVYENLRNPCVNALKESKIHPNMIFQTSSLINDIQTLCGAETLITSFGTFTQIMYCLSKTLKTIHIPDYAAQLYPNSEITQIIHPLPNYIKVGKWIPDASQLKLMLEYKSH